jgi:hypothetical protein
MAASTSVSGSSPRVRTIALMTSLLLGILASFFVKDSGRIWESPRAKTPLSLGTVTAARVRRGGSRPTRLLPVFTQ